MDLGEPTLLFTVAGAVIALSIVTVVLTRLPAEASDHPPPSNLFQFGRNQPAPGPRFIRRAPPLTAARS